ncbi:MAG: YceI family protein [Polyangia bacterium]|jgi:polyisoprenoid-binding protein YceI
MRNATLWVLAWATALLPGLAKATTWEIDPAHSSLEFSVRHMMATTVKGQFEKFHGSVNIDDKDPARSTVAVTVDIASLNTHDPKRDAHLKSPDFFEVAKYPTATFKSTKVQKTGKDKLKVTGELTLHGVTKPVVLEVEGPSKAYQTPFGTTVRGVHSTAKLDRKDFNISWNKALDNGGVLVGNEVSLDINTELSEQKPPAAEAAPAK